MNFSPSWWKASCSLPVSYTHLAALLAALSGQDRAVLELDASLRRGEPVDPEAASRLLFAFCRDALRRAQALLP